MPRSSPKCLYASFIAPQVTVVTPEECQSKPSTQPNAWNHHGSLSRRSISLGPYSSTTAIVTAPASFHMRWKRYAGAAPVCSGSWASWRRIDWPDCMGDGVSMAIEQPILLDVPEQFQTERMLLRIPRGGDSRFIWPAVVDSQDELRPWMPWAYPNAEEKSVEEFCRRAA